MSAEPLPSGPVTAPYSAAVPGAGARAPVTVVIPTKDRADLLRQTLRSVAEQTRPPSAVIVSDDGSSENVGVVAARAGAEHVRNERGGWGAAGARNAGLARARSPFVWFLDSDDLLRPDAIERLLAVIEGPSSPPFAFGQALIAEHDRERGWRPLDLIATRPAELPDLPGSIYVRNSVPTSATLVRTDAARAAGGFEEGLEFSEDHRLWTKLAATAPPAHAPAVVTVYRVHEGSRHTPLRALEVDVESAELAASSPRLRERLPERRGVLLVEASGDALGSGRRGALPALLWHLLLARPERLRTARSALTHYRGRRRGPERALALWRGSPELRSWLARFE